MEILLGLFSGALVLALPALIILLFISIKQVDQYEQGLRFMLGKFTRTVGPGWHVVIPIFQSIRRVDMRIKAVDLPLQESVTKDNISVKINAVIYYKVVKAEKVILDVEDFMYAVSQLAQTTMRNIVGEVTLDELLSEREKISTKIEDIVDSTTELWGVEVQNVDLKDVLIPPDMKRTIAKQAEAEREKRAVIIQSEGEVIASDNMAKAAKVLSATDGALHLRTLQSINDISSDQSNTVVFCVPLELLRAFDAYGKSKAPQGNVLVETVKELLKSKNQNGKKSS